MNIEVPGHRTEHKAYYGGVQLVILGRLRELATNLVLHKH